MGTLWYVKKVVIQICWRYALARLHFAVGFETLKVCIKYKICWTHIIKTFQTYGWYSQHAAMLYSTRNPTCSIFLVPIEEVHQSHSVKWSWSRTSFTSRLHAWHFHFEPCMPIWAGAWTNLLQYLEWFCHPFESSQKSSNSMSVCLGYFHTRERLRKKTTHFFSLQNYRRSLFPTLHILQRLRIRVIVGCFTKEEKKGSTRSLLFGSCFEGIKKDYFYHFDHFYIVDFHSALSSQVSGL